MNDKTDKLLKDALSGNQMYCITCKYSYLSDLTGTGYCKYTNKRNRTNCYPKNIKEFDSCKHWKPKKKAPPDYSI